MSNVLLWKITNYILGDLVRNIFIVATQEMLNLCACFFRYNWKYFIHTWMLDLKTKFCCIQNTMANVFKVYFEEDKAPEGLIQKLLTRIHRFGYNNKEQFYTYLTNRQCQRSSILYLYLSVFINYPANTGGT